MRGSFEIEIKNLQASEINHSWVVEENVSIELTIIKKKGGKEKKYRFIIVW